MTRRHLHFGLVLSLLGAVVSAASCGGGSAGYGSTSPSTVTSGTGTSIVIPASDIYGASTFTPGNLNVTVGSTVTWQNRDSVAHTSTSDTGAWNSTIAPGDSFSRTFTTAGSFAYHCTVHSGMTGTVIVK
jgi:plastocyanin